MREHTISPEAETHPVRPYTVHGYYFQNEYMTMYCANGLSSIKKLNFHNFSTEP